jgi:hypothetical protein
MFTPGNKLGRGRPNISLNKPELLLPIILLKGKVNWANDFIELYKTRKKRALTQEEFGRYKMLVELLPYLCTKVNVKDLDFSKYGPSEADKQSMTNQTASLIKALEDMNVKPQTSGTGKEPSVENGSTQIPPTA